MATTYRRVMGSQRPTPMFEVGKVYVRVKGSTNLKFRVLSIGKTTVSASLWSPKTKQWGPPANLNLRRLERDLADRKLREVEEG